MTFMYLGEDQNMMSDAWDWIMRIYQTIAEQSCDQQGRKPRSNRPL